MSGLDPVGQDERPAVRRMLEASKLPTDILGSGVGELWSMRDGAAWAVGGLEFYGDDALLRSVVVDQEHRGRGTGGRLVDGLLEIARSRGVRRVWLLTETAEAFFHRKGFERVGRDRITNAALLSSPELTFACPTTAVCMLRALS